MLPTAKGFCFEVSLLSLAILVATAAAQDHPACGRPTLASDAAGGLLVSHAGYQDTLLSNGSTLNCAWQLQAPLGSALSVQFQSIGLPSPDDCVQLADPAGLRPQLSACGPAAAAGMAAVGYVSGGPLVSLRAKLQSAGGNSSVPGFRLVYRFFKPADCERQIHLSSANGTVSANRHLAGSRCPGGLTWRWIFSASSRSGDGFALHFLNISLDDGDCLVVVAGSGSELARRCGPAARPEILQWPNSQLAVSSSASTGRLTLTFVAGPALASNSDRWNTSGFLVQYAQVSVCSSNGQTVDVTRTPAVAYRPPAQTGWHFCSWTVTAPPGQRLAHQLDSPGLAASSPSCLTVASGATGSWSRLCGGYGIDSVENNLMVVNDNVAKLTYLSGAGAAGDPGFRMAWRVASTYCGQLLWSASNSSGTLTSHSGYPDASYPGNMDCHWPVAFTPASVLLASVTRLSLADATDCLSFNEATGGSKFCGPVDLYANATFSVSSSEGLSIRFTTGSRGGASGFQLGISSERISSVAACNDTVLVSSVSDGGFIDSHPGYGSEPYPNHAECVWQISAAPGAGQLLAWFEDLQLEACCDRVHLYDGPMASLGGRRLLGLASREMADWPNRTVYNATSGVLSVRFSTDARGTARGFRIRYSTAAGLRRNCSSPTGGLKGPSGRVQSHWDLGLVGYDGSANCSWPLPVHSGRQLLIRFDRLSLRPGDCLSVSTGPTEFRRHCGNSGLDGQSSLLLLNATSAVTVRLDAPTLDGPFGNSDEDRNRGFALRYFWVKACPTDGQTVRSGAGTIGSHSRNATTLESDAYYYCSWKFMPPASQKLVYRFDSAPLPSLNSSVIVDTRSAAGVYTGRAFTGGSATPLPAQAFAVEVAEATIALVLKTVEQDFSIRYYIGNVCGPLTWHNSSSGSLRSHAVDALALPAIQNVSCRWQVRVPPGSRLTVQSPSGSGFLLAGSADCLSFHLSNGTLRNGGVVLRSYCGGGFRRVNLSMSQTDVGIEFRSASLLQPPVQLDLTLDVLDPSDIGCSSTNVVDLTGLTRGSFASHRRLGELSYRRGQNCAWRLGLGANNGTNLRLHSVSLNPGDCVHFSLADGSQPLKLCGADATDRVLHWNAVAAAKTLEVRFSAPLPAAGAPETPSPPAGFGVKFDTGDSCGSLTWNADRRGGTLVSHANYGFTRYPAGLLCYWRIQANPAYALAIDIGLLQLGPGDCVHFYEGSRKPAARVGSYCGSDFKNSGLAPWLPTLKTADSLLLVEFDSEAASAGNVGFGLTFQTLERPVCSGSSRILTAPTDGASPSHLFSHPAYGSWNYPANWRCYTELRAPSAGGHVSVWFAANAQLEPGDRDIVQLYDGAAAVSGRPIRPSADDKNYTLGDPKPETAEKSTSDVLGVLFSADYSVEAAGFQLLFTGEAGKVNTTGSAAPLTPFPLAAVIGGAAGGVVLLILIVVVPVVLVRRCRSDTPSEGSQDIELDVNDANRESSSAEQGVKKRKKSRRGAVANQYTGHQNAGQSRLASEFDGDDEYEFADRPEGPPEQGTSAGTGTGSTAPTTVSTDRVARFDSANAPAKAKKPPKKPKPQNLQRQNLQPPDEEEYQNIAADEQVYQNIPEGAHGYNNARLETGEYDVYEESDVPVVPERRVPN